MACDTPLSRVCALLTSVVNKIAREENIANSIFRISAALLMDDISRFVFVIKIDEYSIVACVILSRKYASLTSVANKIAGERDIADPIVRISQDLMDNIKLIV